MKPLPVILAAALLLALLPSAAVASRTQESMFQDDPLLVYGAPDIQAKTLDRLGALGVDRIRVSVFWRVIAPANESAQRPTGFDATDPGAYPAEHWAPYDRLIRLAAARNIGVNLNLTSPIPRWASAESPRDDIQITYAPTASEFGDFTRAVARRYSGSYEGLPRVDYWSIWNEPNQAGWLTPQWGPDPRSGGDMVESAAHIYRGLVAAAWTALADTGHAQDTILIGETAPKGQQRDRGITESLDPLRFIRQMYCLDDNLQFLTGTSAEVRGCPQTDHAATFVAQNPGLFRASGFAHHPYELLLAPSRESGWDDWVTIADLGDLSMELRRIYQRYGQPTQERRGVPLFLTEYGYQTPPDPLGVPFGRQAAFMNEAEYIAYRNPLVRSTSQFLLNDDGPVPGIDPERNPREAYRSFQSGLRTARGANKPAYKAYITPIHVVRPRVRRGGRTQVFGMVRPARGAASKRVRVQFRARGGRRWRTLTSPVARAPRHYFVASVRIRRTGALRVLVPGRRPVVSRSAAVTVR